MWVVKLQTLFEERKRGEGKNDALCWFWRGGGVGRWFVVCGLLAWVGGSQPYSLGYIVYLLVVLGLPTRCRFWV